MVNQEACFLYELSKVENNKKITKESYSSPSLGINYEKEKMEKVIVYFFL